MSVSGFILFVMGVPILWHSKAQCSVALFSSKAEYVSLLEAAKEVSFVSASLGYRILRSETAATAVAAIVQYEWGDLGLCDS